MRRVEKTQPLPLVIKRGDIEMYLDRIECTIKGESVQLSVFQFNLLRCFAENFERVLTRERVLDVVRPGSDLAPRTVDTYISHLRKKIQSSDLEISMLYNAGYIMRAKSG